MLKVGAKAPDFELLDQDRRPIRLSDALKQGPVTIFFYPKDFTAVCTREVCAFRDAYAGLSGTQIYGISHDDVTTHKRFQETHQLPYSLLSDPDRKVAALYEASMLFGFRTSRVTYVIGRDGSVLTAFRHELSAQEHVERVRGALRQSENT